MLTTNPFADLSGTIPVAVMQAYLMLMILAVVGGTLFDVIHKGSAKYFFTNFRKSKEQGLPLDVGTKAGVVAKTIASDVLTSSELCGWKRRTAHLLGMYGFVLNVIATFVMVMFYPTTALATPAIWPQVWVIGAIMVCVGTSWFWFFIRVDVSSEGSSPFRVIRADLFILSVFATNAFALLWGYAQSIDSAWASVFLAGYLIATTVLFGGVPWSKFSHMFFKPAAALEKGLSAANGSRNNLPEPADRSDPATRDRHSMSLLKDAPLDMGLGIKRETPNHY